VISETTATAILTAIEELATGAIGSVRTMTAGELELGAYDGIADRTLAERVLVKPRFEAHLETTGRNKHVAPRTASVQIDDVALKLRIAVRGELELRADQRAASRGRLLSLAERLTEALTWPRNLAATSAAVATGLVSGCLHVVGPWKVAREDYKKKLLVIEASAKGRVQSTAPVT
jgi:hypothetical protein